MWVRQKVEGLGLGKILGLHRLLFETLSTKIGLRFQQIVVASWAWFSKNAFAQNLTTEIRLKQCFSNNCCWLQGSSRNWGSPKS